jgi:hypothetical protein
MVLARAAAFTFLVASLSSCVIANRTRVTEEVRLHARLAPDASAVRVENDTGSVRVDTWDKDDVLVIAVKEVQGKSVADAERNLALIDVEVLPTASGVSIATRRRSLRVSGGVSYRITIPERAQLEARVATGGVTAAGVRGGLDVAVTTGGVKLLDVSAPLRVSVVTGGVKADVTALDGAVSVETTTGGVVLSLPEGAGATLDMATTTGGISCGFDLPVSRASVVGARASGRVNGGGPDVRVRVVTGGIDVRRSWRG